MESIIKMTSNFLVLSLLILGLGLSSIYSAQHETENDNQQGDIVVTDVGQNQVRIEETKQIRIREATPAEKAQLEQIQVMAQERVRNLENAQADMFQVKEEAMKNQNRVRLAVHNLLGLENFTGKIGPDVSQIAREFNNSLQATIRAEEQIQNRNSFTRFLAGGDHEAAQEMFREVNRNQERIEQLKELKNNCDQNCSIEVRNMFEEQIQNMEQEQNRLRLLAENEQSRKGLFGWIWK